METRIENSEEGLNEFLIFQGPPQPLTQGPAIAQVNWTINHTKIFLDLYKNNKSKVGTFQIKNLKRLWEVLAHELNTILNTNFTPSQCENRWRVLERAYKKFIDNQNKTGQGKKYFEYLDEMDEIFKGKKNVTPSILLSTLTVDQMPEDENDVEQAPSPEPTTSETQKMVYHNVSKKNTSSSLKRKRTPVLNRNQTLAGMRKDRKDYYEERVKIEREKLEIQKERLKAMHERSLLLKERNELLKQLKCVGCANSQ